MCNLLDEKVLPKIGWPQILDSVCQSKERENVEQKFRYLDSLAQCRIEIKAHFSGSIQPNYIRTPPKGSRAFSL